MSLELVRSSPLYRQSMNSTQCCAGSIRPFQPVDARCQTANCSKWQTTRSLKPKTPERSECSLGSTWHENVDYFAGRSKTTVVPTASLNSFLPPVTTILPSFNMTVTLLSIAFGTGYSVHSSSPGSYISNE